MTAVTPLFRNGCAAPAHEDVLIGPVPLTHIMVSATPTAVFNFLADIENLPKWAGGYCESITLERSGWRALTAEGEQYVELEVDAAAGCVDLRTGPSPGRMTLTPLRICELSARQTQVSLFLIATPGQNKNSFLRRSRLLREALLQLPARWEKSGAKAA